MLDIWRSAHKTDVQPKSKLPLLLENRPLHVCNKILLKLNEMTPENSLDDLNTQTLEEIRSIITTMKSINKVFTKTTDNKEMYIVTIYVRFKLNGSNGSNDSNFIVETESFTGTLTSTDRRHLHLCIKNYGCDTTKTNSSAISWVSYLNILTIYSLQSGTWQDVS